MSTLLFWYIILVVGPVVIAAAHCLDQVAVLLCDKGALDAKAGGLVRHGQQYFLFVTTNIGTALGKDVRRDGLVLVYEPILIRTVGCARGRR